ncbi:MAG: 23S rRNA (guanosine(2251)-2'-O)-methyltransferase RlmB [Bacteroidota bacterium]
MPPKSRKKDFIYGARAVMEALEANRQIDKILLVKGMDSELRRDVADLAQKRGIPTQTVPSEKLNRMVPEGNHQGVLAFTALVYYLDLEDILASLDEQGTTALILMLDGVSDVRNFGAIARTAECMGVHALVIPEQGSARINADAMKISAGALHHIPVCRVRHLQDAMHLLQGYGIQTVSLTEKAEKSIFETPFTESCCLIFGAEDKGITPRLLRSSDHQASIPLSGKIASLNVGVSVGMALLEANRQRQSAS